MGGRHSKRSMDVTTTPKKDGIPAEGDAPAVGDGKLERIEEADANTKPTTNGVAPHTDAPEDKDNVNEKESTTEKEKEKDDDDKKTADESKPETPATESPVEGEQVTTPTEETPASPKEITSPDTKEAKKKDKTKKKWSFRSISFSKKDKSKPVREDSPKNGDVSKEEPLAEGGEEAENPEAVSPAEDKSASSPTDSVPESKTEEPASPAAVTLSPAEEKKEAPSSPAPTPAPEAVKEEPEVPVEKVEVSPGPALAAKFPSPPPSPKISPPICSITERKTTEDFPSFAPTSPPPTPIDPSPLQQAQQAAPNATALAEALKPALTNIDSLPITNTTSDSENSSNLHDKLLENSFIEIQEVDNKMADLPEIDAVPDVVEIAPDVADIVEAVPDIADTMEVETEVIEVVPEIVVETEVVEVDAVPPVNAVSEVIEITELEEKITETPQVQEILVPESVGKIIAENIKETAEEVEKKVCERFDLKKVTEEISDILGQVEQTSEVIKEDCEKIEDLKVNVEEKVTQEIKAATDEVVEKIEEIKETVEEKMEETCEKVKNLMTTTEDVEADIPPPLPESPIPVPKASADLMNFIASQISEDFGLSEELLPPPPISGLEQELDNLPVPLDPSKQALRLDKNEEERTVSDNEAPSPLSPTEDLLSPPVNPNPSVESSRDKVNGYKDIETIEGVNGNGHVDVNGDGEYDHESATKDSLFQNNHQSIPEAEAPVENNVAEKTETVEEETKIVPPVVEPPASLGPAITEDVTSVTKAVEEIDINEKAVAAAVNENIEAVNKNEIIAEMNHQNNINE